MADMDLFATMGISGFGKTVKKPLDTARFDKTKRNSQVHYFVSLNHQWYTYYGGPSQLMQSGLLTN